MSFKDKWKSFSAEDKQSVAFWGANSLLWGGITVGGLAAAATLACTAPTLAPAALMVKYCSAPFFGFTGMSMAAISSYTAAELNTKLNNKFKTSLSALQNVSDKSKTKFRDKWRELSDKKKIAIAWQAGLATLAGGLAVTTMATGLPAYIACSCVGCAIGYAVSTANEYKNALKEKELASANKELSAVKTTDKTRSRQKIDEKNMQPQTLETVKNRMAKIQKQKANDNTKSVKVSNIVKLAKKKYTQEIK